MMYRQLLFIALLGLSVVQLATAQDRPSAALERTQCTFQDHTSVTVAYGSMRMHGRKIFGRLVPYGRVWDTGHKQPPTFVNDRDLMVGGKEVTAGRYSLVTVPDPDKWTMVLRKTTEQDVPGPMGEVAGIELLVKKLPSPLEKLTISFDQYRGGCVLNIRWEQTEASVLIAEKNQSPAAK